MTRSTSIYKVALLCSLVAPLPAFAMQSDTTNVLLLAITLGGFSLFNLLLNGLFYFTGKYNSRNFAKMHALIATIPAIIALFIALIYFDTAGAISMNIGVIIVSIGLSLLPLQLNLSATKAPGKRSALIIALAAIALLIGAYYVAPIAIFGIACAHVALISQADIKVKFLSLSALAIGYGYLGYWAYQILQYS
ncbi:hypothetical protein L2719_06700 [Shewanella schlegeliana]|uniref:Uncharacterized protein n=1 Tax=Shewanella schlegeliana TaxID=190308 RepID=A0ABS1SXJ6_9GAMM|nr:hypothetical protein [Shewanella schlegeliana]MBL4913275.1 hypothetical protein [Shewanella schlegeliana]MCL1109230.1 hypothetical protein [Shewanella schlegeliana]GIU24478.1 hypothetical protein TUM4433_08170 [Shewanella schlegeliana]